MKVYLQEQNVDCGLLKSVIECKLRYFGHVIRRSGECLEKMVMQGTSKDVVARHIGGNRMLTWSAVTEDTTQRQLEETGPFSVQPSELMTD